MGTRIRKNPSHIFDLFCEITLPANCNKVASISWKYPSNFKNEEILKSIPSFAYPCEFNNNAVQHFSFVLTNVESQWTFGFCRHASDSSNCFVILSYLPWHELFYKVLNHVADLSNRKKSEKSEEVELFLQNLYQTEIPEPGLELRVMGGKNEDFVAICPDHEKLPSIPENRNMTEYFNAIDSHNMMVIFASMLHERRILMTSKKLSRLSACIQAANSLIYPMHWQHIFIPVLPRHLSDYLSAPMPFLIGVPSSTLQRMKFADMGDIVFLDADENKVETPFADLDALPSEVLQSLRHDLKNPQGMLGDAVARAFLKALVKLIGGYWNALKLKPGEKITFCPELFIQTRPSAVQPFLQKMLELQIFQQFVECRLKKLNSGQGVCDEFEFELTSHADKASFRLRNQYREWVSTMKKESGAFFKSMKTRVKDTGKKAYKDFRLRINDIHSHNKMVQEDTSVPRRRGSVPVSNGVSSYKKHNVKNAQKKENFVILKGAEPQNGQYSTLCETEDFGQQLMFPPLDMDLMGDLQDLLYRRCSLCTDSTQQTSSASNLQLSDTAFQSKNDSEIVTSPEAPPLLPRPPSRRSTPRLSTSSEPSEVLPSSDLLIELDDSVPAVPSPRKHTNPFCHGEGSAWAPCECSQGPSVRNMVQLWQQEPGDPRPSTNPFRKWEDFQ